MDPKQFQYLASKLAEHGAYPAEFRTAISRAYYAVFHFGLNFLRGMGFSILQNADAHEEVYRHFNNSGDRELVKVATKFHDLRTKRNHADYDLKRPEVEAKENAKMWVQSAGRLIESMDRSCNGQNRIHIIKAIQDWKTDVRN